MKKILALVLVALLALSMTAALAQTVDSKKNGPATITVKDANPAQTYAFWRVFEAIPGNGGISYKLLSGKTMAENNYFQVDGQGNVSAKAAAKIAEGQPNAGELTTDAISWLTSNYETLGEKVFQTTTADGTVTADLVVTNMPYGYYYVTTTSGTIISVDSTNANAEVTDKNPGTSIDKTITGVADGSVDDAGAKALAQVGTTVTYESRIPIANGARNYRFCDKMTSGLTLNASSVEVYLTNTGVAVAADAEDIAEATYGTLTAANQTDDSLNDIYIAFDQDWIAANVGKDIVVRYTATVNSDAVTMGSDGNPNTAEIRWGDDTDYFSDDDEAKVYTAKITVKKVDGSNVALEGAGFKLYKTVSNPAHDTDESAPATLKKYYKYDGNEVTWVDTEAAGTEVFPKRTHTHEGFDDDVVSGDAVADFVGLANGTYTVTETTVPAGYNKAADQDVVIKDANAIDVKTELVAMATVTNQAGTELPSTGGIGTTIFYVGGGLLVLVAVIFLVTKRRMGSND